MNIKGIEIIRELEMIKRYTAFKTDDIESIEFKPFDTHDYQVIKKGQSYQVFLS